MTCTIKKKLFKLSIYNNNNNIYIYIFKISIVESVDVKSAHCQVPTYD